MNTKLRRLLLPLLRAAAKGGVITFRMRSAAQQGLFLLQKPKKKLLKAPAARSIRPSHAERTAEIRRFVMGRANFVCEACGIVFVNPPLEMDHFLGGSGRRREKQAVENCWALCRPCHHNRTYALPSVEHWNERFAAHAAKYGYPPIAHITHSQLKRSAP